MNPKELTAFLPYLKLLLTSLNKLPLVRTQVYRGVNNDLHEEYNQLKDEIFTWWAFSSTTKRETQSEVFLGQGNEYTWFSIDAIGVDIAAFSSFPGEQEVLLLPGTCLVVEPGVMAKPKCWRFEASVWKAAQRRHQQHQLKEKNPHDDHDKDEKNLHHDDDEKIGAEERSVNSDPPGTDEGGRCSCIFQNTDLPHPDWEQLF